MLKIIDKVRWEAAKQIYSASFGNAGGEGLPSYLACQCANDLVNSAIELGWVVEYSDSPTNDKLTIAIEALKKIANKDAYLSSVETWNSNGDQVCLSCCQLSQGHDESCQLYIASQALNQITGDDNEIPKN
jgi:hypothetical protein